MIEADEPFRPDPDPNGDMLQGRVRLDFDRENARIKQAHRVLTEDSVLVPGDEGDAYLNWKAACVEMQAAKATYDASTVKVRDALQKLAEFATNAVPSKP